MLVLNVLKKHGTQLQPRFVHKAFSGAVLGALVVLLGILPQLHRPEASDHESFFDQRSSGKDVEKGERCGGMENWELKNPSKKLRNMLQYIDI